MRKTTKLFLGFTAGLLLLCGCSAAEEKLGYENADVAKEALASASSVRMRCDLDNVDASGNIYADEKAAAYMKNSGLFDQTWTISISGEEWFHMKIVTDGKVAGYLQKNTVYINDEEWFSIDYVEDEPINAKENSGTTYGYYDASGTCLGYAQEQYVDTSYGKDTRLIFLDVDETPLDYQSSRSGRILYDENDEEIGSGKIGRSGVSLLDQWYTNLYCAVFKTETDGARQIDFMDRMAMLWRLERDYRSIDDNPVNTGVQIYETVAVVFVLILLIGSSFSKWRQKKKN